MGRAYLRRLVFVTNNPHKVEEARSLLEPIGIDVVQRDVEKLEIQSEDLSRIALAAARFAFLRIREPLIVEDSGLFIEALRGFPGPYSSFVYKTIGITGILRLMEGVEDRRACFKSVIALVAPGLERVFEGVSCGLIAYKPSGGGGFGFDPIFVPEGGDKTFAEMSLEEKNSYSHRGRALRKLADFILSEASNR